MSTDAFDRDDQPLFPLLGFTAGVVGGAVALRLEFGTCRETYTAGTGETQQYVMTPEAAIEIGQALIERGALAQGGSRA